MRTLVCISCYLNFSFYFHNISHLLLIQKQNYNKKTYKTIFIFKTFNIYLCSSLTKTINIMKTRQLKKSVLKKYPNATNLVLGNNDIVNGIWFEVPNDKLRYFMPFPNQNK